MNATQPLNVTALSAPLAAIDRRSLSQAWYSALHLAKDVPSLAERIPPRAGSVRRASCTPMLAAGVAQHGTGVRSASGIVPSRSSPRSGEPLERRSPRLPLAHRIERAVAARTVRSWSAAALTASDGARVILVLRGNGERLALVAICSPSSRPVVARALEQARFALAARGIVLNARVRGAMQCS